MFSSRPKALICPVTLLLLLLGHTVRFSQTAHTPSEVFARWSFIQGLSTQVDLGTAAREGEEAATRLQAGSCRHRGGTAGEEEKSIELSYSGAQVVYFIHESISI